MVALLPHSPGERPLQARLKGRAALLLRSPYLVLALVFVLALGARVYDANWDDNTHQHPDERHITMVAISLDWPSNPLEYFDSDDSPLNPYNRPDGGSFVYGTLPVFANKALAGALGMDHYDGFTLVGRYLSAVVSAATVLVVFFLGRRLYGSLAGLFAAALFAAAPLSIQHAHFFVTDTFLAFFTTAALYYCLRVYQEGRTRDYVLAGLCIGLGVASKLTALALLPVLALAVVMQAWPLISAWWHSADRSNLNRFGGPASAAALALLVAFIAFRVTQPYAFETPGYNPFSIGSLNDVFLEDQSEQSKLLGGTIGFPPSVQWIARTSYLYPLQQMVTWGMGPVLGIIGWLGALYAGYRLFRHRELIHALPLLFVLVYFGFMGRQFSLYMRYFLPLYPVIALFAGLILVRLLSLASQQSLRFARPQMEMAAKVAVGLVLVGGILAGLAYLNVYRGSITRIQASSWAVDNIPAGSIIATEHWDDRVPSSPAFEYVDLPLYEPDTETKVAKLIETLNKVDYISISSNRLLESIPRNPVNYPVSSRYYDLLLDGQLGFRLVQSFESYPSLLGIEFSDWKTEESFSSYDHPRVLIFQKTSDYSADRVKEQLGAGPFADVTLLPAQADRSGLLSEEDSRIQQSGGTFSDVFSSGGIVASQPTLLWLLLIQVAALAVTPLCLVLFRRLPDRGYLLAKPLGVLLLAYPVWLIVSLKVVHFHQSTVIACLFVLLGLGALLADRYRDGIRVFVRENWKLILFSEALFLLAFLFFRELRLANPDLWHSSLGGEKPMDLAYLTAITRSTTLPPYDPWLAGGYINYYYLGHFFTATLSKATTIPPEVAFNLAIPTFFALTVAAVFSVVYNLAAVSRSFLQRAPGRRKIPGWGLYVAGLVGAVLVAISGNLDGVAQLSDRLSAVSSWQLSTGLPLIDPLVNGAGGLWQVLIHGKDLQPFDFWRSSRMLPPQINITEFPYFSFLFADLHAHMMAIPFQGLTVAICLSLALSGRDRKSGWQDWVVIGLLGLVVGSLRWINSWDYPPFLLLAVTALIVSERHLTGGWGATLGRLSIKAAVLVFLSFVFYAPFLAAYQSPVSGLHASLQTTPVDQYLAHFGLLWLPILIWLGFLLARAFRQSPVSRALIERPDGASGRNVRIFTEAAQSWLLSFLAVLFLVGGASLYLSSGKYDLLAVLLPLSVVVAYLFLRELGRQRPDSGLRLFLLTLVGLCIGLSGGVDIVTINGDIERMNTVFKFYLHIWLLLALTAAFATWHLVFIRGSSITSTKTSSWQWTLPVARGAVAVLFIGGLVYPLFATGVRLDTRFEDRANTLDGMAYMENAVYRDQEGEIELSYDLEGIRWLRENVQGTPTIVEGRTPIYRWGGRFSIYTGLPAVVGWDWHQIQQRGSLAFVVQKRTMDVDAFYNTPDASQAMTFLRRYNVQYVMLGQLERLYYDEAGMAKFRSNLSGALQVAYSNQELTIYRVLTDAAAVSSTLP